MSVCQACFAAFEHLLLLLKGVLEVSTPDVPEEVQLQLDRQDFITSKIIDNTPGRSDTPQALQQAASQPSTRGLTPAAPALFYLSDYWDCRLGAYWLGRWSTDDTEDNEASDVVVNMSILPTDDDYYYEASLLPAEAKAGKGYAELPAQPVA